MIDLVLVLKKNDKKVKQARKKNPHDLQEKTMRRAIFLIAIFLVITPAVTIGAPNPNANWRALVAEAYAKSNLVMSGTVQSVEDQTMVDGGHVYNLHVTNRHKGDSGERVKVRAGGFFYRVALNKGDSVLVFLKSTKGGRHTSGTSAKPGQTDSLGPVYSLIEIAGLRPMVFRESGTHTRPVDNRLQSEFSNVTSEEMKDLLANIKPLGD